MRNPLEIYNSIIKTNAGTTVLGVFSHLNPYTKAIIEENDKKGKESFPMEVWNQYSVFKFSIISGDGSLTANMKPQVVDPLYTKVQTIASKAMERELLGEIDCNPAQEQQVFRVGKNKGKTPAQVLLESGESTVFGEISFLQQGLAKYQANAKLIDACNEAINLYRQGKLNKSSVQAVKKAQVVLLDAGWRPDIYHPQNINGVDYYNANKLSISYDESSKNPFLINISVSKAPIVRTENGGVNFLSSKALQGSYKSKNFFLSVDSMVEMISIMKLNKDAFYSTNFKVMYDLAWNGYFENKKAASSEKPSYTAAYQSSQPAQSYQQRPTYSSQATAQEAGRQTYVSPYQTYA